MIVPDDVMDFHRSRAVVHHAPVAHAFHLGLSSRLGQEIRTDRRGRGQRLRQELAIALVRDDGDADRRKGAETAGMIEMVVARDDVADRLRRHQFADGHDHAHGALVVEWRLHDDHVVLHLDSDAVVAAAGEVPDAVGHFLVRHARVGPHGLLDRFGHLDVDGCVRPDLVHGELEPGRARGRLRNLHRKLHTAEVLVVRVPDLD